MVIEFYHYGVFKYVDLKIYDHELIDLVPKIKKRRHGYIDVELTPTNSYSIICIT